MTKLKLEMYYKLKSTQNKINLSLQKSVINSHAQSKIQLSTCISLKKWDLFEKHRFF